MGGASKSKKVHPKFQTRGHRSDMEELTKHDRMQEKNLGTDAADGGHGSAGKKKGRKSKSKGAALDGGPPRKVDPQVRERIRAQQQRHNLSSPDKEGGVSLFLDHLEREKKEYEASQRRERAGKGSKKKDLKKLSSKTALTGRQLDLLDKGREATHQAAGHRDIEAGMRLREEAERLANAKSGGAGPKNAKKLKSQESEHMFHAIGADNINKGSFSRVPPIRFPTDSGMFSCSKRLVHTIYGLPALAAKDLALKHSQLQKIRRAFIKHSRQFNGSKMSHAEFFQVLGVLDTEFIRVMLDHLVFSAIDMNPDHCMDLNEFILATSMICMFTKDELVDTIFHIFDGDSNGHIDHDEFQKITAVVNLTSGTLFPQKYSEVLERYDENNDGKIGKKEFHRLNHDFPQVFYPAFKMVANLRKSTLGDTAWRTVLDKYYTQAINTGQTHSFQDQIYIEVSTIDRNSVQVES